MIYALTKLCKKDFERFLLLYKYILMQKNHQIEGHIIYPDLFNNKFGISYFVPHL